MDEHVKVLGAIGIVRSLLALSLGLLLISKAAALSVVDYSSGRVDMDAGSSSSRDSESLPVDRNAFLVVGGACLAFAALRLAQAAGALFRASWSLPLGLGLAVFDVLNLTLFPVSTALGLYGLVVFRHPATKESLRARRRG